jgi:signal transduction histidine kinase
MADSKAGISEVAVSGSDLTDDYSTWLALKPYIGHCLTMNHDINNPLAGVLGYCEFMLLDDDLSPAQRKHLEQINECAERIKKLVEALCDDKIALTETIDLRKVSEAYQKIAKPLE